MRLMYAFNVSVVSPSPPLVSNLSTAQIRAIEILYVCLLVCILRCSDVVAPTTTEIVINCAYKISPCKICKLYNKFGISRQHVLCDVRDNNFCYYTICICRLVI